MPIPSLESLLAECWDKAENAVMRRPSGGNEEQLTFLFKHYLEIFVEEASIARKFEKCFRADLQRAFPELRLGDASNISHGLIASVSFHHRGHEGKKSAADLGVVLVRPNVSRAQVRDHELQIDDAYSRALLVQAKLRDTDDEWGQLTENQVKLAPQYISCYCLLLLEYADLTRSKLEPFGWQLCSNRRIRTVVKWLQTGRFPLRKTSRQILEELASGKIGTDDPTLIEQIVAPVNDSRSYLEISIKWPDDAKPAPKYRIQLYRTVQQPAEVQQVQLRRGI